LLACSPPIFPDPLRLRTASPQGYAPAMTDTVAIRRALLSVSDKAGLVALAQVLARSGVELLSTGGTARTLREAGIPVIEVSDHTGVPEMLDGRVKTLVPQIHGGILARRDDPAHLAQLAQHTIAPIDLVVVNLYPFEATVASGAGFDACVEQIDIGGPALIRAAAKNHAHVLVLTEPAQYAALIEALGHAPMPTDAPGSPGDTPGPAPGGTTLALRREMAAQAYARTAAYDAAIAAWFARQSNTAFPHRLTVAASLVQPMRYGENPHQQAAFYSLDGAVPARPGVATSRQVQGKPLSYNNLADTDAAFECVAEFDGPAVVIVKHANPCGVAVAASLPQAWDLALRCDPSSAFGGVVALNRTLDEDTAARIATIFTEVIVAPDASEAALAVLSRKTALRLLLTGAVPDPAAQSPGTAALMLRSLAGGLLVQTRDTGRVSASALRVVTRRAPDAAELADLLFAFRVCKHVKSNAIVYARGGATVGIGAGQMSRVDSARVAVLKGEAAARAAGLPERLTQGSVVASDAFFPFADGLQAAIDAGATAVIQPGGSVRDAEVVAAADAAGLAMVFTGMRHFRH
jgi:phosphoribosylaminoimidazolecarboxamide formyltransferase/IMP cyclohydrolase